MDELMQYILDSKNTVLEDDINGHVGKGQNGL